MINAIARNWSGVDYPDVNTCVMARTELDAEKNRLEEEISLMGKIKQAYENDVIPHLSKALSQMETLVGAKIENAINILKESYKTDVKELENSLNVTNETIDSSKGQISNLKGNAETNLAHIDQLIGTYQRELGEVQGQIERVNNAQQKIANKRLLMN